MSDPRRILEAGSDAAPLLRDLVSSARSDAAPDGARQRARARMEAALGSDGMTTTIAALSEGAAGNLILPNLSPVAVPTHLPTPPRNASAEDTGPVRAVSGRGGRTVVFASVSGAMVLVVGMIGISMLLRKSPVPPAPVAASVAPAAAPIAPVAAPIAAPLAPTAPVAVAPTAPPTSGGGTVAVNAGGAESGNGVAGGGGGAETGGGGGGGHARAPRSGGGGGAASSGGGGGASVASSGGGAGGGGSACAQRCHGNIECLLRCSTQSSNAGGGGGGGAAAHSNAPEMPSRTAVIAALHGAAPRVSACGHGRSGMAQISITFSSTGRVTNASVGSPYGGTPAGACMARAVQSATLPRFSRPTFTVNYPFSIR